MKKMKQMLAFVLVVVMIFAVSPSITMVDAATDSTYGFHVSGSQLLDANGNPFIMRGMNHAHTWFKDQSTTALNAMASLGCNTARIVLSNGKQWTKDDLSSVKNLVQLCKDNNMIAVLEVHDATGKTDVSDLLAAANYFVEMKEALIGNEAYVIVNIANEWDGTWESSTWKTGNIQAIQVLRDAGIKNTIMIDSAGWGQYPQSIADSGNAVFDSDPLSNTMFSTHMYEYAGGDATMVKNNIDKVAATGLCQIIGEFGWKHSDGDVDEDTIMSYCDQLGIGYLAWSWKGNGGGVEYLDLSNDWAGTSLSDWGTEVVYGTYGLKNTSKTCSVFTGETPTTTTTPSETPSTTPSETPSTTPSTDPTTTPTTSTSGDSITLFSGSKTVSSWQTAVELGTIKNGDTFDPSVITSDGYFKATYTGTEECLQMIFQSWSGGSGWAVVTPSSIKTNSDGSYTACFNYNSITASYGTSFSLLDRLYLQTQNGTITLQSFEYVK